MNDKIHAWKVVRIVQGGSYVSPLIFSWYEMGAKYYWGKRICNYKLNDTTKSPTVDGLFCFKTRKQARECCRYWRYKTKVLKAEIDFHDVISNSFDTIVCKQLTVISDKS